MATFTATAAQSTSPAKYIERVSIVRSVQFSLSASMSSGDVMQMVTIPKGAVIEDMTLIFDGLGGGNYTVQVGDGNSAGRYFASLSTGSTSSINRLSLAGGFGYSYSAEDTIDCMFSTATTASAVGTVRLVVTYNMDNVTN